MAELPEHVKARADAATETTGVKRFPVENMGPPTEQLADAYDKQAMAAQRDQQRENSKAPEQTEQIKPEETPKQ
jgi:hypothetical protein